jgi:mannose-6-phosphate isomerase
MTYRLYDYGRPRELHLEDALAVCTLGEYPATFFQRVEESDERVLIDGPKFTFAHCHSDALQSRKRWVLPLEGTVHCDGEKVGAGECLLVEAGKSIETTDARLFVGAEY